MYEMCFFTDARCALRMPSQNLELSLPTHSVTARKKNIVGTKYYFRKEEAQL